MNNNTLHTLLYVSSATVPYSEDDLTGILKISRENNSRDNISGILLYSEGNIIQVLEGDKHNIYQTYQRIGRDSRHTGVIKLIDKEIESRDFPDWSMAFKTISKDELNQIEGFKDLNSDHLTAENNEVGNSIISILKNFIKNNN